MRLKVIMNGRLASKISIRLCTAPSMVSETEACIALTPETLDAKYRVVIWSAELTIERKNIAKARLAYSI